ncbi:FAD-dependent oxidoreductase [Aspergillus alliaceus]|uniref:FAD-dependent oxidoreductase n=1 Tax=Petromyces alliaceus TaxID=209559 RepID=UPI0012A74DA8|nr:uncharacterized protein BDW43DRAFT_316618 [Aspergillus alliaceus]KAB8227640.1 hypothetical protein BDW43DRAFT_316618 [Aspergillus alliaceus]
MAPQGFNVLIVGAGITGLLLAQTLKAIGIRFRIFESEVSAVRYRPREWAVAIHWALPMLREVLPQDLWHRLKDTQTDPLQLASNSDYISVYNSGTGKLLKKLPGVGMRRFSRRKLRALCSEGIAIEYNKTLTEIVYQNERGVTAKFGDGTECSGDILIGCDGAHSKVRNLLFGEASAKPVSSGVSQFSASFSFSSAAFADYMRRGIPLSSVGLNPSGVYLLIYLLETPEPSSPETWIFQINWSWLGPHDPSLDDAGRLAKIKSMADTFSEPFRSICLGIPGDTRIYADSLHYWVPRLWTPNRGRVTLAGDAAHPMLQHRGQGINNCIRDVLELANAMKLGQQDDHGLMDVISSYDREMISRGEVEVQSSVKDALLLHTWHKAMESPFMKMSVGPRF